MCWGPTCIIVPNLIKIGQNVADKWWFNGFPNATCLPSWIFEIQFLTVCVVKRPILHHNTKFRTDRSNSCADIAIFAIFKMAAAAILDHTLHGNASTVLTATGFDNVRGHPQNPQHLIDYQKICC